MKQNIPVCSSHQSNLCTDLSLSCVVVVSLPSIPYSSHQFMRYNTSNVALFTYKSSYEQLKLTLCNENHSIGYIITFFWCISTVTYVVSHSQCTHQSSKIYRDLKSSTSCFFQRTTINTFKSSASIPNKTFKKKKIFSSH